MDLLDALVLGVIQGVTEWLPISSSGHLVIAQEMLGLPARESLLFDLVVHLGTLVAVCAYFYRELGRIISALLTPRSRRDAQRQALWTLGVLLLVATVPAAVAGLLLSEVVDELFNVATVGAALVANGLVLIAVERTSSAGTRRNATLKDAVIVGTFQAISIVPGISRSGITISGGMLRGLERETAAVFAFLLSVPTLAGAFAYGLATLDTYDLDLASAVAGFAAALLTGVIAIAYLLRAVRKGRLWVFGVYCLAAGSAVLAWALG
ncbi:MAG: undecaprenyl-diphosphate phosphatase [Thermoplasmata archaeon]